MQDIIQILDNLPSKGAIQLVKGGLFSKKEEELYVCPNGHKNHKDQKYCVNPECGLNIKGLTKEQVTMINRFKRFTAALSTILS